MQNTFEMIQNLLRTKAEYQARLNLIPYEGSIDIKENSGKKYLYIRKREAGKVQSTYVGLYSEELHQTLLRGVKEARELKKQIRAIEKELAALGYGQPEPYHGNRYSIWHGCCSSQTPVRTSRIYA